MAEILHARVSADGLSLTGERKRLDPQFVLSRAQAQAVGKTFWLPVITETADNSTPGAETVTEITTSNEIQPARVYNLRTIRDKTAQEIAAERDAALAELDTTKRDLQHAVNQHTKELTAITFALAEQINPGLTLAQFQTFWDNNKDNITMQQFKSFLGVHQS